MKCGNKGISAFSETTEIIGNSHNYIGCRFTAYGDENKR